MSNINLQELKNEFYSSKFLVIIQKKCGYQFLVPLLENATIMDLYRYVELYYEHIKDKPLNLYFEYEEYKKFLPKNSMKIKEYIRDNFIKPVTNYPDPVVFRFTLDLCDDH